MMQKTVCLLLASLLIPVGALAEGAQEQTAEDSVQKLDLTFWAAPNPTQEAFWSDMAERYVGQNQNVSIEVTAMPESPTSEAGIQTAIAGGTAPTASENIFIGFGGELARSQAIVPLQELSGWDETISGRNMEQTIENWQFGDGNYYILPIYTNAMLFSWRLDILSELGYDEPPRAYNEILEMGSDLQEQMPDTFVWARNALTSNTWWERWFDFFIFYNAASGGAPLIQGNDVTADDEAAIQVLEFFGELAQNDYVLTQESQNPFETGLALMIQLGPWTFPSWEEQFPELQLGDNYELTQPPAPARMVDGETKTFADAKGLVLYRQASEQQRQEMWDFIRWVYSDPANDLKWMRDTSLPPARDDLATNETFQEFFSENPELVPYAENISNAVPPIAHPQFTEIQRALGDQAVIPVVRGEKDAETAWNDWKEEATTMMQ
jgi:multiple sugar transport system substrate-binding protein